MNCLKRRTCLNLRVFSVFLAFFVLVCSVSAQPVIELIYFVPKDVDDLDQQADLKKIVNYVSEGQKFFATEMDRLGFEPKTFEFNKDIVVVSGKKVPDDYKEINDLRAEIPNRSAWHKDNIQVIFLAGRYDWVGFTGVMEQKCFAKVNDPSDVRCKDYVIMPWGLGDKLNIETITAHEIGHALDLDHITGKSNYLMNRVREVVPGVEGKLRDLELSIESAEILNASNEVSSRPDLIMVNTKTDIDADVNDDGYIDLYDVLIVRSGMQNAVKYDTDLNNDGVTNEVDLLIVKAKAMEAIVAASPRKRKVKITTWGAVKQK